MRVVGVDMHIGSQIIELDPFGDAFALLADFVARAARRRPRHLAMSISAAASAFPIATTTSRRRIPTPMRPIVKRATHGLGCKLIFEPGRLIVGNAGILVTRVLYVKRGEAKTFVIVDAGMNDLVRPTLYEAHHDIRPVRQAAVGAPRIIADVVGPVCEIRRLSRARPRAAVSRSRAISSPS